MDYAIIVFAVVLVLVFFMAVKTVPQGWNFTVERFGKYIGTLQPGIHFIVPVVDSIGRRQNMMEQVLNVLPQEIISKDNASVEADGVAYFQIMSAEKASYQVANIENALVNLVMTNIRAVLGSMELDEMLSNREKINYSVQSKLDEATTPWGIKVTRVEIKNINPPADLQQAMNNQMKAERNKRAYILEAEGQRAAAITVAEGQKQAEVLKAEGERQAAFLQAEARERAAEAEAKATEIVSAAIAKGDNQAIQYFVAQQYVKALGELTASPNSKVIMMPLEASSVIGSIEGIRDLLQNTGK
ncbi:MAG: SPFH/Band 7/PHB domain protein [Oceanospirillaceae bacterium]|nr:SPFH/Band 7/PHB domain protein [Oceanospirillaceae bacterium]MCP5334472.1 SPFH/Band 7/PHB domain protein [Oceanospirillaceae bacterium]MCP5350820.1 SPFH/Band 7/PHB domain protein [Oceanospirillaceae bacterium]